MNQKKKDVFNWFSKEGGDYARYRPEYPVEIAKFLSGLSDSKNSALDVGCDTGQLTRLLSIYFERVIGVDPSEDQLRNVFKSPVINYFNSKAESFPLHFNNFNLITVAKAAHWFQLEDFYKEIKRVAASYAIIALISYGVLEIEGAPGERFREFYYNEIGSFWPPERQLVDNSYKDLFFPFEELSVPSLNIEVKWDLESLLGYISIWSATINARQSGYKHLFIHFLDDVKDL
ncbi:class I SAM-dependent methyltransferase [Enterobacter ludwigii]|nr:class I SAM-dependent methyltransferase [Enterobacter ludwigii]